MRAGSLNKKVLFQVATGASNDFGEPTNSWSDFATAYVSIVPLRGKEYFSSKGVKSEVSHKIELRFMPGVTTDMKIVYGSRTFEIESAINVREQNRTLEIMATEVV